MWYPQFLPGWLSFFLPGMIVRGHEDEKIVHLTFDDGPIPEVTPWVLDMLKEYDQKATFFCVGENVKKHPEIFARIQAEGHAIGNHTMHHRHGWKTGMTEYLDDVREARTWIDSRLFRPPYGKLTPEQYRNLKDTYSVIMWSYLSRDYEENFRGESCIREVKKISKHGCILVFHDNIKTYKNIRLVLPAIFQYYQEQQIKSIPLSAPEQFL